MGGQGAKTVLIEAQQAARPRLCEINIVIYPDHPFSIGCLSDMILKAVFCIINEPHRQPHPITKSPSILQSHPCV